MCFRVHTDSVWRVRRENALACLNELVTDALALVPDCLAYMRQIKHPEVFRFCAIPQVRVLKIITVLARLVGSRDDVFVPPWSVYGCVVSFTGVHQLLSWCQWQGWLFSLRAPRTR